MNRHHAAVSLRRTASGLSRRGLLRSLTGVALGGSVGVPAVATLAAPATPAASAAEADRVRATEADRLRALVEADMDVAEQLHADDYELITGAGVVTRAEYLGGIAAGEFGYEVFEPVATIDVRVCGEMALIRYQANVKLVFGDAPGVLEQAWYTHLYEQRAGQWQVVWSQATSSA